MTIADSLTLLATTKTAIKSAIEAKGVTVGAIPFAEYPSKIAGISGGGGPPAPAEWARPADWLALPAVTASDQKFVGLHAIYPDSNFIALSAAGNYTVDWGDGVVENFAADAVAQHEYDYTTYDAANATLCSRGYKQAIVTVTPQAGQSLTALNLHRRHSAMSVVHASGFLDIALASADLIDLRIGVATPGDGTQTIVFRLLEQVNVVKSAVSNFVQLFFNCSALQSVVDVSPFNRASFTLPVTFTDAGDLVTAPAHGLRNGDSVVLIALTGTGGISVTSQYYVVSATADTFQLSLSFGGSAMALTGNGSGTFICGTSFSNMFQSCVALKSVPLLDTSASISFFSMFNGCTSLQSVPLLDTSTGKNFTNMFLGCVSLKSIPLLNTAAGTDFTSMFQTCYSLQSVPLLNTAAGKTFNSMFQTCSSLQSVPLLDTSASISFFSMFNGCTSLQSVPMLNLAAGTNFTNMFNNCASLQSVPLFNTAAGTIFTNMFNGCASLQSVPLLNTAAGKTFNSMFQTCSSLQSVPMLNLAAGTSAVGMFQNCSSLSNIDAIPPGATFSVANCKLSTDRLNEIYTNLPTVTAKTITVTGNYGAASDTPSIATAKGWTVTG